MRALVLQCRGPTAVVNTSLAALIRRWRTVAPASVLYGGHQALNALITGEWRALGDVDDDWLSAIEASPGMALGGGRTRLTQTELEGAVSRLASQGIAVLFLLGGNGTMAVGRALSAHATRSRVPLRVIGVPKTVDNDIPYTDACPGFASAARFLVDAVANVGADVASMRGYEDVVLIETMGRHTGWLAVATAFARTRPDEAPHVVLVPEEPFDEHAFLAAVREQHARTGTCVVTI